MSCFSFLKRGSKNSYDVTSPYEQSYSNARYSVNSNNLRYSSTYENESQGNRHVIGGPTTTENIVKDDKPRQIQTTVGNDENSNQHKVQTGEVVKTESTRVEDVNVEEGFKVKHDEECHEESTAVGQAAVSTSSLSDAEQHHEKHVPEVEMQTAAQSVNTREEGTWQEAENEEHELDSTSGTWDSKPNFEARAMTTTTHVKTVEGEHEHLHLANEEQECHSISSGEHENEYHHSDDGTDIHANIVNQTESGVSVIRISSSAEEQQEVEEEFQHHQEEERRPHDDYELVEGPVSVIQITTTDISRGDPDGDEEEDDNRQNEENEENEESEFLSSGVVVTSKETHRHPGGETYSTATSTTTHDGDFDYRSDSSAMVY